MGAAEGSDYYPPIRSIMKPCRIVIVSRTRTGYDVTGETHLDGQPAVSWRVQSFATGPTRSPEEAEAEANQAATAFAERTPESFTGQIYVVNSRGRLVSLPRRKPPGGS